MVLPLNQNMLRQLVKGSDGGRNVLISINPRGDKLQA